MGSSGQSGWDIWVMPLFGDRKPFPVVQSQSNKEDPSFSADGKWLAYDSDESGQYEIFVEPFPGPGAKTPISNQGGRGLGGRATGGNCFLSSPMRGR